MQALFDLTGKNIIFTAAASYLGKAMSEALAAYGANMLVTSRDKAKAERTADLYNSRYAGKSAGFALDIGCPESVREFFLSAVDRYGVIDTVVNNASFSAPDHFHNMSYDTWVQGINGTINSAFLMIHEALPHMLRNGKGNIINIASMYGVVSPDYHVYENTGISCNPANYGAGKAALIQLTKYIACNYGKDGIRANTISPGSFPQDEVKKNKTFVENLSKKNPLNRVGSPDDLQGVIVFLASDASSYMTGQNLSVDGGWTAW